MPPQEVIEVARWEAVRVSDGARVVVRLIRKHYAARTRGNPTGTIARDSYELESDRTPLQLEHAQPWVWRDAEGQRYESVNGPDVDSRRIG